MRSTSVPTSSSAPAATAAPAPPPAVAPRVRFRRLVVFDGRLA
jgi:hypothetical protein